MRLALQPISLVSGFVLAAVVFVTMGQIGVPGSTWGPAKKDIVNIFQEPPSATIAPGGSFTVCDVPSDRWLTVTGVSGTGNGLVGARWAEDLQGVITPKGNTDASGPSIQGSGGAVGLTFRPGSRVIMQNTSGSMSIQLFSYSLVGYLSRD